VEGPARTLLLAAAFLGACSARPALTTPLAPAAPVCPLEGCAAAPAAPPPAAVLACASAADACAGAGPQECTERALAAWSEATDDRDVACVARMLLSACALDDPRACGFAGRMLLDGRGVARDPRRALDVLVRACDGGVATACTVAAQWLGESPHAKDVDAPPALADRLDNERACLLGQAESCYQVGLSFYYGHDGYPRDRVNSSHAFSRGCDLGESRSCNNLGDALAYGDGIGRDAEGAAAAFLKACHYGEALGCANLGFMAEHGQGVPRDLVRARALYRQACGAGDIYGCLHADMVAAQDAGVPRDPEKALARWRRACDARDARACAFVGVMYEDGPDGYSRDEAKSTEAMTRACELGETRACEWVKSHP
jgi:TPR repeat protein